MIKRLPTKRWLDQHGWWLLSVTFVTAGLLLLSAAPPLHPDASADECMMAEQQCYCPEDCTGEGTWGCCGATATVQGKCYNTETDTCCDDLTTVCEDGEKCCYDPETEETTCYDPSTHCCAGGQLYEITGT